MLPRLQEIEADLLTRRARADSEGWLGEIEGLDLTLAFLRDKRKRLERTTTSLGMPVRNSTESWHASDTSGWSRRGLAREHERFRQPPGAQRGHVMSTRPSR